jgi:hypothetical protein
MTTIIRGGVSYTRHNVVFEIPMRSVASGFWDMDKKNGNSHMSAYLYAMGKIILVPNTVSTELGLITTFRSKLFLNFCRKNISANDSLVTTIKKKKVSHKQIVTKKR